MNSIRFFLHVWKVIIILLVAFALTGCDGLSKPEPEEMALEISSSVTML